MIGLPESQESTKGLVVLIRDMDWREMTAPIKPGQHDGIQAIVLAVIPRLSGDERWGDDFTRKSVVGKQAL